MVNYYLIYVGSDSTGNNKLKVEIFTSKAALESALATINTTEGGVKPNDVNSSLKWDNAKSKFDSVLPSKEVIVIEGGDIVSLTKNTPAVTFSIGTAVNLDGLKN